MVYEDFRPSPDGDYTEVDPNSHISVASATHIDVDGIHRDEIAYVVRDMGVDHFTDFEHLIDAEAISDGWESGSQINFWTLLNVGTGQYPDPFIRVYFYLVGASFRLYGWDGTGSDYTTSVSLDTPYYFRIERASTTFTVKIYSTAELRDANGTADVDTLTFTCIDTALRYIYPINTFDTTNVYPANGDIDNLDLQEPVAALDVAGGISTILKTIGIISLTKPKFRPLFPKFKPRMVI